jgi:hypothetical protein
LVTKLHMTRDTTMDCRADFGRTKPNSSRESAPQARRLVRAIRLMNNSALFLDRDGVINVDRGYVHRPDQFEFVPGIFPSAGR